MEMSKAASPTRFSGDFDHFYDPNYTADISQKMRVPKRIKVDGLTDDENSTGMNNWSTMLANEKFDMHVPDRILVTGQDQHFGTRAPPRELLLENSIMPSDPGSVRVAGVDTALGSGRQPDDKRGDHTPAPSNGQDEPTYDGARAGQPSAPTAREVSLRLRFGILHSQDGAVARSLIMAARGPYGSDREGDERVQMIN
uniref:Mff-like domain-containing protein n=1 Tax=Timema shepardi TaxID=629360 RepID=A0A7R9FXQ2_TIMSH|nr:unnamed protein product [Timema shepardi]